MCRDTLSVAADGRLHDCDFNQMLELPLAAGAPQAPRTIAEAAGVSVQAVSLALRKHPTVGSGTRARIEALARQLGYTPDPQLTKLMQHLRAGRGKRFTASVCALTTRPPRASTRGVCRRFINGIRHIAGISG
jgi:DNA-binding LacI/PurR family transcriptional regulator